MTKVWESSVNTLGDIQKVLLLKNNNFYTVIYTMTMKIFTSSLKENRWIYIYIYIYIHLFNKRHIYTCWTRLRIAKLLATTKQCQSGETLKTWNSGISLWKRTDGTVFDPALPMFVFKVRASPAKKKIYICFNDFFIFQTLTCQKSIFYLLLFANKELQHILLNISRIKGNQTIIIGQLIEHPKKIIKKSIFHHF